MSSCSHFIIEFSNDLSNDFQKKMKLEHHVKTFFTQNKKIKSNNTIKRPLKNGYFLDNKRLYIEFQDYYDSDDIQNYVSQIIKPYIENKIADIHQVLYELSITVNVEFRIGPYINDDDWISNLYFNKLIEKIKDDNFKYNTQLILKFEIDMIDDASKLNSTGFSSYNLQNVKNIYDSRVNGELEIFINFLKE